jgi:hypothetical protein
MAQTKRKRQTKHRGNAAGVVESRGRTGRKPTAAEKAGQKPREDRSERIPKRDRPPTWLGAFYRAMAAAVLMLLVSLLLLGKHGGNAIALFPIVLVLYLPISYYTDMWLYNRRMRNKARQGGGKAPAR